MKTIQIVLLLLLVICNAATAQRDLKDIPDPDPLRELETFVVPDGFEVNLYAADPQIAKPIQMNFDEQGRLWIASSEVYPHIKPGQKATDKILVVEDRDRDGVADKTSVFVDGLLIPTGVVPGDGGCYVANSTDLIHFADLNGDLKADRQNVVLSGFGTEDTHHLLHTLRWGHDGALYMNQSIYIHSHVETPYGVKRLRGGGIWQFRPESMQLNILCEGFVNPWGHHFDRWGQHFATDGAYGEGINYVFPGAEYVTKPGLIRRVSGLNPGSPKHCGLEIISGRHIPESWQGSMVTNDFRAHRVCRFVVTESGSGYASTQEEELIKTTHVAFRPIDVKMGPDGAIYIADWYNPIIQHGEVDFRDERRDHLHGRIWRISAKGRPLAPRYDVNKMSVTELFDLLLAPEEWLRLHAKLALKGRNPEDVESRLNSWLKKQLADSSNERKEECLLEAMFVLQCIDRINDEVVSAAINSDDHRLRARAVRVISENREKLNQYRRLINQAVRDGHERVRLEAVRALGEDKDLAAVASVAGALESKVDQFMDFAIWKSFRDLSHVWLPKVLSGEYSFDGNGTALLTALEAVQAKDAAKVLLNLLNSAELSERAKISTIRAVLEQGNAQEVSTALKYAMKTDSGISSPEIRALVESSIEITDRRKLVPFESASIVVPIMDDSKKEYFPQAVVAAGAWKVIGLRDAISELANDSEGNEAHRVAAIYSLGRYGDEESIQTISLIASNTNTSTVPVQIASVQALAGPALNTAINIAIHAFNQDLNPNEIASLIEPIIGRKKGPEILEERMRESTIPADVARRIIRVVQDSNLGLDSLIATIRSAGKLTENSWKFNPETVSLLVEAAKGGDPVAGESVFRRKTLQCMKCHAIGGAGGKVGPDLVSLGASAQVDYLVASLLAPNDKVKENFHSIQIIDADGQVHTGIQVRRAGGILVLRNAKDELEQIAVDDIELEKEGRSLMPDGLVDDLTKQEIADLISFLSALGKVGDFAVSRESIARTYRVLEFTPKAHFVVARSSFNTIAIGHADLQWEPAYTKVNGEIELNELPIFKLRQGVDDMSFLQTTLRVSNSGSIGIVTNGLEGIDVWIDGKPIASENLQSVVFENGDHVITFGLNRVSRNKPLLVKTRISKGSSAQAQWLLGK